MKIKNYSNFRIDFALESFKDIYLPTYTRATPWLCGILLGYEIGTNNWKPEKVIRFFIARQELLLLSNLIF